MKKIFLILLTIFLMPCLAAAAQDCGVCPDNAIVCNPLNACSFQDLIDRLISIVAIAAIALVPLMFVWAGIKFVTAGGEPEKIKQAKNIMLYTVIGLGIVLFARAIISLIKGVLGTP